MRNFLLTIVASMVFFGPAFSQKKGYEINGHFDGLENGMKVKMLLFTGSGPNDYVLGDSAYVKNGDFHISGFVPEGPRLYWLTFLGKAKDCILRVDNNEVISIRGGNMDSIPHGYIQEYVDIDGARSNYGWNVLLNVLRLYLQNFGALNNYLKEIKESIGYDRSLVEGVVTSKSLLDQRLLELAKGYGTPFTQPLIPMFLDEIGSNLGGNHQPFLEDFYNILNEKEKNSFYGKKLKESIILSVGKVLPGFNLPTADGKTISLKEQVAKNKLTIVHIWASNSYMRKEYQDELKGLYKVYHDKGLGVVSISADSIAAEWKARAMVENFPWPDVSDLKGNLKGSIVQDLYHEGGHGIPNTTNILLDEKGKILAWDPQAAELQWFLDKDLSK